MARREEKYEEMYKGRKIVIKEEKGERKLFISDQPVQAFKDPSGGYSSREIAYTHYGSLQALARAMIDRMPEE